MSPNHIRSSVFSIVGDETCLLTPQFPVMSNLGFENHQKQRHVIPDSAARQRLTMPPVFLGSSDT